MPISRYLFTMSAYRNKRIESEVNVMYVRNMPLIQKFETPLRERL